MSDRKGYWLTTVEDGEFVTEWVEGSLDDRSPPEGADDSGWEFYCYFYNGEGEKMEPLT